MTSRILKAIHPKGKFVLDKEARDSIHSIYAAASRGPQLWNWLTVKHPGSIYFYTDAFPNLRPPRRLEDIHPWLYFWELRMYVLLADHPDQFTEADIMTKYWELEDKLKNL